MKNEERFKEFMKFLITNEGTEKVFADEKEMLLCSNCFTDQGLRLDAEKIGHQNNMECKNCKSTNGAKLSENLIGNLAYRFFVRGTFIKGNYGAAPVVQFNAFQETCIEVDGHLKNDIQLIERAIKVGFFYYGPRLWMIGEIEPLIELQSKDSRQKIASDILNKYPVRPLEPGSIFYRIRKNPVDANNANEYDSAPNPGSGRLDFEDLPVLYASGDIEVCLHECRVTVEDELFMASLEPCKSLKMLDLTELLEEEGSEFESLDLAVHMLFHAGQHSYEISRDISNYVRRAGYDGIIYPSYFSTIRIGNTPFDTFHGISIRKLPTYQTMVKNLVVPNIAIFGKPIEEGKVKVNCINRVVLNKVTYDFQYGPVKY